MTDTTTPDVFQQFLAVVGNQAFMAVNTVVVNTLNDIQANPQAWLNPLSGPVKGAAAVAALTAALPTLEGSSVTSAAALVEALWTQLGQKLAAAAPSIPTTVATITGGPVPSTAGNAPPAAV